MSSPNNNNNNDNKRRRISGTENTLSAFLFPADETAAAGAAAAAETVVAAPVEVHSCAGGHNAPIMSSSLDTGALELIVEPPLEGIPQLLLVDLQQDDAIEVGNALYKLQDLITTAHVNSEQNRQEAYDLGAHMIALMAMRKWPRNEKVQLYGCSFITLLAKREQKGYRKAFVNSGGFHTIIKALQTFPEEKCLQSSGFRAIYNLVHDDLDCLQKFVTTMNGIRLLLTPMKKYPDHTCLLTACCAVFGLLAKETQFKAPLRQAGVISAVAAASERHMDNVGIQTHAGIFMKRIYS